MRTIFCVLSLFFCITIFGQDVTIQVQNGITNLEKDPQFKHAILSMYVVDSKTGKVVFEKNSEVGLAPASCQKVITSASAFELLGKEYRYKTEIYAVKNNALDTANKISIIGYGDPTLGSWRYESNKPEKFIDVINEAVRREKLNSPVDIYIDDLKWGTQSIPNGWIWEDIGNYYGAGAFSFNWNENQYEISLQSGNKVGDDTYFGNRGDATLHRLYINDVKTASAKTGDNAYVYLPEVGERKIIRGTIPLSKSSIIISASAQSPVQLFSKAIKLMFFKNVISKKEHFSESFSEYAYDEITSEKKLLNTHYSPPLDSINYWFLKKSINLYGEAFLKTIGYQKKGVGATDTGLSIIKYFWKQRGIDPSAINIIDGSGLSPANRITTNALVTVMQFAKKQNWFSSFYNALPDMNGIKMKDGYISGVRSYTGYVKSKSGNDYTFAFIVNNFDGSAATVKEKMWKVLNILK